MIVKPKCSAGILYLKMSKKQAAGAAFMRTFGLRRVTEYAAAAVVLQLPAPCFFRFTPQIRKCVISDNS